ncbi:MAG: hypothetical protein JW884_05455 [Deltaproteobacteria bacterium]|nr:hypothetical protein [Deltaproteobacteria bacterium]
MKTKLQLYIVCILTVALCSCQGMSNALKGAAPGAAPAAYKEIQVSTLPTHARTAITTFEMARDGRLDSDSMISVDKTIVEALKDLASDFRLRAVAIMNFKQLESGAFSMDMVAESVDTLGRIDRRKNHIVYAIRRPSSDEADRIAAALLKTYGVARSMSQKMQQQLRQSFVTFQQSRNLAADGIMGRKTAEEMVRDVQIMDISEMTSSPMPTASPRIEVYVVPFEIVEAQPGKFSGGFKSLPEVKKQAVGADVLRSEEVLNKKMVAFIYFFDRYDPSNVIRVSFAPTERRWTSVSPVEYYAPPDDWPVIVESFSIDRKLSAIDLLYVNLFTKKRFLYECIASRQIM